MNLGTGRYTRIKKLRVGDRECVGDCQTGILLMVGEDLLLF